MFLHNPPIMRILGAPGGNWSNYSIYLIFGLVLQSRTLPYLTIK